MTLYYESSIIVMSQIIDVKGGAALNKVILLQIISHLHEPTLFMCWCYVVSHLPIDGSDCL